jgi:integrase
VATVLAHLSAKAKRSRSARGNLMPFRLAACCGLRVSEIAALRLDDVVVGVARPHLRVRGRSAKGGRARRVPLWWDGGTLADLIAWKSERLAQGARGCDPFIVSPRANGDGTALKRHALRRRASPRPARRSASRGSARSPSTTAGTRSSATRWLVAAVLPRSATPQGTRT